jgi:tetratricopeptide (TPR) repeat protein
MRVIALFVFLSQFFFVNQIIAQQTICSCDSFTPETRKKFESLLRKSQEHDASAIVDTLLATEDPCCQAVGFTLQALIFLSKSDFEGSFSSAKTAQNKLGGRFHPYVSIESSRLLGNYYSRKSNHDSSTYFYFQALDGCAQEDDAPLKAKIYNGIALDFLRQEQLSKGLEFTKKALASAIVTNDTLLLAQYFSDLGIVYWSVYDKNKNIAYLDSTRQTVQQALRYAKVTQSKLSLTKNYLSLGSVAEAQREFATALSYTDTLMGLVTGKTRPNALASIYMLRGAAYSGLGQHKNAIENQVKALGFARQVKNSFLEKTTQKYLYEAYKAAGETTRALQALERHKFLSDSLVTVENLETISRMEQTYNKKINEQKIRELSQMASIQALELRQKNFWLIGMAVGAGLMASIVFLYFRQRSLTQQQKALAIENKFLRFQLDPHFLSNALVSIQRFMMDNNAAQASSYLTKFSKLMRQLLEYSREEFITIEEEIDLLRNYLDIQKLRLKNKFEYEINVDSKLAISDSRIPPMFAQPFVENAIEHGIGDREHGKIVISFSEQDNQLLLEIQDDGAGIAETSPGDHKSLSTTIIRERIALLNKTNKKPIQLRIGNVSIGSGTHVALTLPIYS